MAGQLVNSRPIIELPNRSKGNTPGMSAPFRRDDLIRFQPRFSAFVGIDSDGCVFDSMEIKQKRCFHGLIVRMWHLEPIERYVRETAEFVNLYSRWRGQNRFPCLVRTMDLLRERPEVRASGVPIPELNETRQWIATCRELGNPALERRVNETGSAELALLLQWSKAVNEAVARECPRFDPFPHAREGVKRIAAAADAICVSQTPTEALMREWREAGLLPYVAIIAGQELGTKTEHLQLAADGKYPPGRILMIGDAPGDLEAARAAGALFFPINPGHEDASWERFCREGFDRFLEGRFAGAYETELIREFEALLPETPPWTR